MIGRIDEYISNMENGVFDYTNDGKCSQCGGCCSDFLPMSKKDIKRIHSYVKKNGIKEQKHNAPLADMSIDLTCPFRSDEQKKCLIYPVRPAICRDFKCDNAKNGIWGGKHLYHDKFSPVSMRAEFFGGDSLSDLLRLALDQKGTAI